jgi:hypothetical protein
MRKWRSDKDLSNMNTVSGVAEQFLPHVKKVADVYPPNKFDSNSVFNISGLRGNFVAADDKEILHFKKQQLLKMSEDEISSKLYSDFDTNPFFIFKLCIRNIFSRKINFLFKSNDETTFE